MLNVKIKKSVLQNIIKKSLNEREMHNDPSRRLTIGPDTSSLPSMLPLSPSDRMSTQLETERPPVEDPEYIPANSKELGNALQALAEMIPADNVGDAYSAFQKTIEEIELQNADNIESQLESIRRKSSRYSALLREAPKAKLRGQGTSGKSNKDPESLAAIEKMKDYKPKADELPTNREEQIRAFIKWLDRHKMTQAKTREGLSDQFTKFLRAEGDKFPGRDDVAAMMRDRDNDEEGDREELADDEKFKLTPSVNITQILLRYPEVCDEFKIDKSRRELLSKLIGGGSITKKELITFLDAINDSFLNDKTMKSAFNSAFNAGKVDASRPAEFIKKFSDEDSSDTSKKTEKDFEYQSQAGPQGYKAASGLRQAFIRDVQALFALMQKISSESDENAIETEIRDAFEDAFMLPQNQKFLDALYNDKKDKREEEEEEEEEEEKEDRVEPIKKDINIGTDLSHYQIYRNFRGSIMSESLANIGMLNFLGKLVNGKRERIPGRKIALAFMTEFGDDNLPLQSHEADQLESMATDGSLLDAVIEAIEAASEGGFRSLLMSASKFSGEDADKLQFGKYDEPAFSSLKKFRSGTKPPEVAAGEYVDDSPEGRKFVDDIKSSDRAARKFKSTVPKNK